VIHTPDAPYGLELLPVSAAIVSVLVCVLYLKARDATASFVESVPAAEAAVLYGAFAHRCPLSYPRSASVIELIEVNQINLPNFKQHETHRDLVGSLWDYSFNSVFHLSHVVENNVDQGTNRLTIIPDLL
jgi:hypothetical protein